VPVVVLAWWLWRKGAGVQPASSPASDEESLNCGRDARATGWTAFLAALGPIVVFGGAWFLYNLIRFGEPMPERVLGREYLPGGFFTIFFLKMARDLLTLVATVTIPLSVFTPFWLLRTGMTHVTGILIMILYLGPPLLALTFTGWRHRQSLRLCPTPRQTLLVSCVVGILAAWFIAVQAVLHDWNTGLYAGRYAVDSAPALALLLAAGMRALFPWRRARLATVVVWLLALLVIALLVQLRMTFFFQHGTADWSPMGGLGSAL
jgi:hypothetical protein